MESVINNNLTIEYIIENYGKMVYSICRRMIQNKDTADDAAQEVWLEVNKSLKTFRGESKISTWIYTITSRIVLKMAKEEHKYSTYFLSNYFHGEDIEIPDYEDFDKQLWVREMCDKCLTGTLHCLDNESRLAYILRDINMLPYSDIAAIFEKDEASIRKMVSRSRNKLRNFLNDECMLKNPDSKCKCRMSKWVKEIQLDEEYKKLRQTVNRINFYRASEIILTKDYLLK
ncbi:MAG TPA: sigma-70 family RNA polymerase sigma factor [Clostridiales bacterium]|nr:sigma-70 family RNA polymerase sigma factor [Clostridiales bacterium]